MKKMGLLFMLVAMMAAPMLACGFPVPISTDTGMAITTDVVCAETEAPESCELRQNAYAMMAELNAVSVEDMNIEFATTGDTEGGDTAIMMSGRYDVVVNEGAEPFNADMAATIEQGSITGDSPDTIENAQIIIKDGEAYTSDDGGETWSKESFDEDTILGLGVILGLGGAGGFNMDLFSDPTIFTVTLGDDMDMMGQTMKVQTLSVDLAGLLGNPDVLGALMESNAEAGDDLGLGADELGDPAELAMMSAMLLPMMGGTEFSSTLYIGADDGYIHRVEHSYVFNLDASMFDPESEAMSIVYQLDGNLTNFNADLSITAPAEFSEDGGLFDSDLFGDSSGLGQGLFGE